MSATPVVHLKLLISPRIFEKIRNGPIDILRGLGETDSWKKKQKSKISWHRPFLTGLNCRFPTIFIFVRYFKIFVKKVAFWCLYFLDKYFGGGLFVIFFYGETVIITCLAISFVSCCQVASFVFDLFANKIFFKLSSRKSCVCFFLIGEVFSAVMEAATYVLTFLFVAESLLQSCFWKFFQFLFVSNSSHQNSPTFVCCSATYAGSWIILIHPLGFVVITLSIWSWWFQIYTI